METANKVILWCVAVVLLLMAFAFTAVNQRDAGFVEGYKLGYGANHEP